jgi:hypothetical protein
MGIPYWLSAFPPKLPLVRISKVYLKPNRLLLGMQMDWYYYRITNSTLAAGRVQYEFMILKSQIRVDTLSVAEKVMQSVPEPIITWNLLEVSQKVIGSSWLEKPKTTKYNAIILSD